MTRHRFLIIAVVLSALFLLAGFGAWAQSPGSQAPLVATPEQQKQLYQLTQLEQQLDKDRTAMHDAIAKYGWDSDQADTAQEQLLRDRSEYRKLRRTLRRSGVTPPPPAGFKAGGRHQSMRGRGMHCPHASQGACDCPCRNS